MALMLELALARASAFRHLKDNGLGDAAVSGVATTRTIQVQTDPAVEMAAGSKCCTIM